MAQPCPLEVHGHGRAGSAHLSRDRGHLLPWRVEAEPGLPGWHRTAQALPRNTAALLRGHRPCSGQHGTDRASLREIPDCPYWIACITLGDGRRTQVSTRIPIKGKERTATKANRRDAQRFAEDLENPYEREERVRRILKLPAPRIEEAEGKQKHFTCQIGRITGYRLRADLTG